MAQNPVHVVVVDDYSWLIPDMVRVAVLTDEQLGELADGLLSPTDIGGIDLVELLKPALGHDLDLGADT